MDTAIALLAQVIGLLAGQFSDRLAAIEKNLEKIMSEDAAIQGVTTDLQSVVTELSALVKQALADIAAGNVTPSTVTALQSADSALDAAMATFKAGLPSSSSTSVPVSVSTSTPTSTATSSSESSSL
jgi:exonuclease VII small subunit